MSNNHNLENDFKIVTHKRKQNKSNNTSLVTSCHSLRTAPPSKESSIRRIEEAKAELLASDLYDSFVASLKESYVTLNNPTVRSFVCLGLGKISECTVSRYQLALVLCLKDLYSFEVSLYDPIFTDTEKTVLQHFSCVVLNDNKEGKYAISESTIFYLPHCPKQLTNNLLWANWGLNLTNCIIISNSFSYIVEKTVKRLLEKNAPYLLNISPYTVEIAIINGFKYFEIFSDTAVHVFPQNKLNLISQDFWEYHEEPQYSRDDVEFIQRNNV